jgi:pullulanase/glycogen debranching enzyme
MSSTTTPARAVTRVPTLCFRGIDHLGYYRLTDDKRNDYDVTGCGNSVDTSEPGVLRMVLDSLRYWVTEMGVDGFRFDLATTLIRDERHHVDQDHPFKQAIREDPVLSQVKIIAEPWDMGPYGYQVGAFGPAGANGTIVSETMSATSGAATPTASASWRSGSPAPPTSLIATADQPLRA